MINLDLNEKQLEKAVERAREKNIILPTFKQMKNPELIPDKIKEKLISEEGPPPFLGYRAEVGDGVIPIAEVGVREDGVGYGGQIKFEMKLDKRFANRLSEATSKIYSED